MSTVYKWRHSDHFSVNSLSMCCPSCEHPLTLHQPDLDLPDRLLATCDECKSWFLANSDATVLIPIPESSTDVIPSETDSLFPRIGF